MDIKVSDHPNLVRRRGAIVNTDRDGYMEYMAMRESKKNTDERIESLESQVKALLDAVALLKKGGGDAKKQKQS